MDDDEASIAEQLAEWGKVALIETRGRVTGRLARAAVGFIEEVDGHVLVAAGSETADWALNLRREPVCRLAIGDRAAFYSAEELHGAESAGVVTALILKYGTPAERLGRGPVFRLRPASVAA